MSSNEKIYNIEEIFALNQTDKILKSKAKEIDKNFYHYTKLNAVDDILFGDENNNKFFFVRNIDSMNDVDEKELHKKNAKKIHSFCTCCTKYEKIPLWYLYSGISGKGARIGFTPGKMIKFLNSITCVYPVNDNKVDYVHPLKIEKDFELKCGWVYYLMGGNTHVIHKNKLYKIEIPKRKILENNFFVKKYPWKYECEFRIVFLNKTNEVFEKIAIPIPENIIPTLEIMSGPENKFTEKDKIQYISYGIKREKIKDSDLKIKMDLFKNNKNNIISEIDDWCDDENCLEVCKYIKSKNKCKKSL